MRNPPTNSQLTPIQSKQKKKRKEIPFPKGCIFFKREPHAKPTAHFQDSKSAWDKIPPKYPKRRTGMDETPTSDDCKACKDRDLPPQNEEEESGRVGWVNYGGRTGGVNFVVEFIG